MSIDCTIIIMRESKIINSRFRTLKAQDLFFAYLMIIIVCFNPTVIENHFHVYF